MNDSLVSPMKKIEKLANQINNAEDLKEMGELFRQIRRQLTEETLSQINIKKIARKIEETTEIGHIAFFLKETGLAASAPIRRRVLREIDFNKISAKIKYSHGGGASILLIKEIPPELKPDIIKTLDFDTIVDKIDNEASVWAVGVLLKEIKEANRRISQKIAQKIDLKKLAQKIATESNIWDINTCLGEIQELDEMTWRKLVKERIHLQKLAKKVEKSNATELYRILEIFFHEKNLCEKFVRHMKLDKIARRIDEGANIVSLIHLLERFPEINEKLGKHLLAKINQKKFIQKINRAPLNLREYAQMSLKGKPETEDILKKINFDT